MPNLFILAGCNGAGKTTAAYTLLPEKLSVLEFINADEIARGLSPFNVDSVAIDAGRLMLQRIDYLMSKRIDFAFETTLSTRSYVQTIKRAQEAGYTVSLFYVFLDSPEMAVERVAQRVMRGGHNIPTETIYRRYERSISNFFKLYAPVCDYFLFINNSGEQPIEVAKGGRKTDEEITDYALWYKLKTEYGD